jgi:hypothetical protein
MRTYITPSVVNEGTVTESTRSGGPGTRDPKNVFLIELAAAGSVGFQL